MFSEFHVKSFSVQIDNNRPIFLRVNILYHLNTPIYVFYLLSQKAVLLLWTIFFYLLIRLSYFPACLIFYLIIAHVLCMSRHSGNNLHINQARLSFNPFFTAAAAAALFCILFYPSSWKKKKKMKEDCCWDYILFFFLENKNAKYSSNYNPFLRSIHSFTKPEYKNHVTISRSRYSQTMRVEIARYFFLDFFSSRAVVPKLMYLPSCSRPT